MRRHGSPGLPWSAVLGLVVLLAAVRSVVVLVGPAAEPRAQWLPATAIALLVLARTPVRGWVPVVPAVAAALVLPLLLAERAVAEVVVLGVGDTAAAVAGALVLGHGRERAVLRDLTDLRRLLLAALAGAVVTALTTTAVVWEGGLGSGRDAVPVVTAAVAYAAATLVLLPIGLVEDPWHTQAGAAETLLQVGSTAAVTVAVLAADADPVLLVLPLTLLAWAALRLGLQAVAWELAGFGVLVAILVVLEAGPGLGPRAGWPSGAGVAQAYLACVACAVLALALLARQRSALLARVSADERLFRRTFRDAPGGQLMLQAEPGGLRVMAVNDAAAEALGARADSLIGSTLEELLDASPDLPAVGDLLASGAPSRRARATVRARPGVRVDLALTRIEEGDQPLVLAQLADVSAVEESARRLVEAEKLIAATLDTVAGVILVTDLEGRILRANSAVTELTGWSEAELVGRLVWETGFAPHDQADIEALLLWPNRSGMPVVRERDAETRTGAKLRMVWSNNIVRDEHGSPTYAVLTGIDVTSERTSTGLVSHLMQAPITTALVGVDAAGRITAFNAGAEQLTGHAAADALGEPFVHLLDPDQLRERAGRVDETAFVALVGEIDGDGGTPAQDWTWLTRGGGRLTVSTNISRSPGADGDGFLVVGRDVTELRLGQEMLVDALEKERTAVERLRALDDAKNEFVSTVSHELRTPVTSIMGYTEMLQDGSVVDPAPEQQRLLDTIARNGQRLLLLCNDLLTLTGLDQGTATWRAEPVDLVSCLATVRDSAAPFLLGRSLDLDYELPSGPLVVEGDRAQLERVALNLVGNAVKFTEDGGVVRVRLSGEADEAVLSVTDTGIGIPLEEQEQLFQKFFRTSTAQKEAIQGTGLGLSIVAAIVSAHGGSIRVRSAHLEGATFTVRLPLQR